MIEECREEIQNVRAQIPDVKKSQNVDIVMQNTSAFDDKPTEDELESFTTWVLRAPTWVAAIYNLSGRDLQVGFVCVIYIQFKGDNGKKQKSSFVNGML